MRLTPSAPYDFGKLLALLLRFPCPSTFSVHEDAYFQVIRKHDALSLTRATEAGGAVEVTRLTGTVDQEAIRREFSRILGIEHDLTAFYAFAEGHPALWKLVQPLVGLPIYRTPDLYHALLYVIIEQHISWAAAQRAQRALVEWGGNIVEHEGVQHYALPTPAQIATASVEDLRPLKITFKRMQLLIDISRAVVDGSLDLGTLSQQPASEMYRELLKIKGVGHWTASVVIGRVLGDFPYVPHNDVGLQAAVARYFNVEKSAKATQRQFNQYGEFAGLAAHFTLMRWVMEMYTPHSGHEDEA